jgi:3-oxoacyl-[acyl-carrier protein] reductase
MSAPGALRLPGKVAVVTGAASGLGLASAVRFGSEGAAVACVDLSADGVAAAAEAVVAAGGRAIGVAADVTDEAALIAMVAEVTSELGAPDVLYANAGTARGEGAAHELPKHDWDFGVALNLTGVFLSAKAVLPGMLTRRSGVLLLQGSIGGLAGLPNMAMYAATKGAVVALARQMAIEYAGDGIRVNAICPGTIETPLVREAYARRARLGVDTHTSIEARKDTIPLGRLGDPEDVANLALFLASDEAGWITGAVYTVDGGESAALIPRHIAARPIATHA